MKSSTPSLRRILIRVLCLVGFIAVMPLCLLVSCQSSLIYFPRPYGPNTVAEWKHSTAGKTISFKTSQGNQRAFLQGNLKTPRHLWIVCGGNGTVALDWSEWLTKNAPNEDAWLLVDFPGYGDCEGSPSPKRIQETLATAVPLAWREAGWQGNTDPKRLRIFGHSLGAAACLIAASEFKIQRGVLLSPFTSTMDMSRVMTGLPLGFLVTHRFDNEARLAELSARGPGKIIILHGDADEVIPVEMSRALASKRTDSVRLIEIANGRHNTIQEVNAADLAHALRETGM